MTEEVKGGTGNPFWYSVFRYWPYRGTVQAHTSFSLIFSTLTSLPLDPFRRWAVFLLLSTNSLPLTFHSEALSRVCPYGRHGAWFMETVFQTE